ncbi:MAG: hypothetical protein WBG92_16585 [Thiohalocapsa sp.]
MDGGFRHAAGPPTHRDLIEQERQRRIGARRCRVAEGSVLVLEGHAERAAG